MVDLIYKIMTVADFESADLSGVFHGTADDRRDGYIHFSTAQQVRETAAIHFQGQGNLMLVAVDVHQLGDTLRWEASRGGQLFPHLYGPLDWNHVAWSVDLPMDSHGNQLFPADMH